jgi:nifR3 family TIM-barrel protein
MDGVTDHPFRFIHKKYGHVPLLYTEFTSVEGVCHGAARLLDDFLYDETQRPIIAQIYGSTPLHFRETAVLLCELGFDGIDINMGCPAKNVAHSGAGAALIKTPELAQHIIRETKAGVQDYVNGKRARDCATIKEKIWQEVEARHAQLPAPYQARTSIPVSVKTRIGYHEPIITEWLNYIVAEEPEAIAVHGRTLKQQYGGLANWEEIGSAAQLVKSAGITYLGNGDVQSRADALEKCAVYGVDGVLIGRASFGNPYIFCDDAQVTAARPPVAAIALEHAKLYEQTYSAQDHYSFMPMRKHLGWYVRGIPEAATIRQELFKTNTAAEVKEILEKYNLLNLI